MVVFMPYFKLFSCLFVGRVPSTLCDMSALSYLSFGDNTGLMCFPQCLTHVTELSPGAVKPGCQGYGVCGFIAATNIATIIGFNMWQCSWGGLPSTDPCALGSEWNGVSCADGYIFEMELDFLGVTGIFVLQSFHPLFFFFFFFSSDALICTGTLPDTMGDLASLQYLNLDSNDLIGR